MAVLGYFTCKIARWESGEDDDDDDDVITVAVVRSQFDGD